VKTIAVFISSLFLKIELYVHVHYRIASYSSCGEFLLHLIAFPFILFTTSAINFGDSPAIVCSILRSNSSLKLSLAIL
jgi:hypothetical protein